MQTLNIGLDLDQRKGITELLNQSLANLSLLLIKTKKYHWDVVGLQFQMLHELWGQQYEAIAQNVDECAERVRMLGGYPLGTAEGFLQKSTLREHPGDLPTPTEMVAHLVADHEEVIRTLRQQVNCCSQDYGDEGTADFLTALMEQHEKMAWMLRSLLESPVALVTEQSQAA